MNFAEIVWESKRKTGAIQRERAGAERQCFESMLWLDHPLRSDDPPLQPTQPTPLLPP